MLHWILLQNCLIKASWLNWIRKALIDEVDQTKKADEVDQTSTDR